MIGQSKLKNRIINEIENNTFPHFVILSGPAGSGKKTLIRDLFNNTIWLEDNKIDSVRKMIDMAYRVSEKTFILPDIDPMTSAGKQALLKVLEECPNNNYFIVTTCDANTLPHTIRSRGRIYKMGVYTLAEIREYVTNNLDLAINQNTDVICDLAETPGEVNKLATYDVEAFVRFVESVFYNIDTVSGANVFKIADRISMKDDDSKYDMQLFFRMFSKLCIYSTIHGETTEENLIRYGRACSITNKYAQQARLLSVNKAFLFDSWMLEIRRAWM